MAHPLHCHEVLLTLTFSRLAEQCVCVRLGPFYEHLGLEANANFIHTFTMMHPAQCRSLLSTFTSFSRLTEQFLVCACISVSWTPPAVAI